MKGKDKQDYLSDLAAKARAETVGKPLARELCFLVALVLDCDLELLQTSSYRSVRRSQSSFVASVTAKSRPSGRR